MKTNIALKNENLWERIKGFSLDAENSTFPFSKKLSKEENWSLDFTKRAIDEYKKFVYLCCILPNGASPSETVDKVWHMHLIYTHNYWEEFCPHILQQKLHHHPSKGGESEHEKHKNWLDETLKSYQKIFQQEPPQDIWKPTINPPNKNTIFSGKIILMLSFVFIIYSCRENNHSGITAFSLLAVFFVIIVLVIRKFSNNSDSSNKRNDDNGSDGFFFYSCGSDSSHGDGGSSSGCSSSCGSSCGSGCGGCGGGD